MTSDLLSSVTLIVALTLIAGVHVATWGAHKDMPYEGYHPLRQVRTLLLAGAAAILGVASGLLDAHAVVPAVGVVYTLERLATEWWKTIVRVDDQSAYTIPMRLGFRGRPVDAHGVRYSVGALVLVGLLGTGLLVHVLQRVAPGHPGWLVMVTVGGLGGWATAVGGAWKDAPIEGFSGWKFLRSPAVASAWAVPLSVMTNDWVTLCLAAGGLSVASIETYKTFFTGGRPPGKFADQAQRSFSVARRRVMGTTHAVTWFLFAGAAVHEASSVPATSTGTPSGTFLACLLVGVGAGCAAALVLRANLRMSRVTTPAPTPPAPAPASVLVASVAVSGPVAGQ